MKQKPNPAQAPMAAAPATDTSIVALTAPQLLADYLTRAELAAELGKCVRTIDLWHAKRIGPPRVTLGGPGGGAMYRRSSVARWIEAQERDPAAPPARRRRRA